jgi:hypothetical protein
MLLELMALSKLLGNGKPRISESDNNRIEAACHRISDLAGNWHLIRQYESDYDLITKLAPVGYSWIGGGFRVERTSRGLSVSKL